MNREIMRGYIPPEEIKEKKQKMEVEMVDVFIETASFVSAGANVDLDKISKSAEVLTGAANSEMGIKLDMAHKTEGYVRTYEAVESRILIEKEERKRKEKNKLNNFCFKDKKDI